MRSIKRKFNLLRLLYLRSKGIRNYLATHKICKLHLGAGPHIIDGWFNTDVEPKGKGVYFLDVSKRFPVQAHTFDYIFTEHLIEHFTYKDGLRILKECYRVLKPGGTIRIATPDIDKVISLRTKEKNELQTRYIKWHIDNFFPEIGTYKDIFVINSGFSGFGHRFLYDYGTLENSLRKTGYTYITRCTSGQSGEKDLWGVDFRAKDEMTNFSNLIVEGTRPDLREIELPDETNDISFFFDRLAISKKAVEITGWAYINGKSSEDNRIYIILRSDKKPYIFETVPQRRIDVTTHFSAMNLNFDDSGFSIVLSRNRIEKGDYRIGIYIEKEKEKAFQYTDKTITI